jgi:hypothetical protein
METKTLPIEQAELKFSDDDWAVSGYASVFDSVDKVGDTILPGAFQKSLEAGVEIKMYYEHSRLLKPGKWDNLAEDERGLKAAGHLTRGHSLAADLRAELRHGTVRGMSIGFYVPEGGAEKRDDGGRTLHEIELVEVSFTGSPAEPKAIVTSWKSELEAVTNLGDFEAFLRESGPYSRSMATALTGHLKRLIQSESEATREETQRDISREAAELKALLNHYALGIHILTKKGPLK